MTSVFMICASLRLLNWFWRIKYSQPMHSNYTSWCMTDKLPVEVENHFYRSFGASGDITHFRSSVKIWPTKTKFWIFFSSNIYIYICPKNRKNNHEKFGLKVPSCTTNCILEKGFLYFNNFCWLWGLEFCTLLGREGSIFVDRV